ncbi:MAG: hypothetical protein A2381_01285 [Bdellovibrionales bacterium RIFOXYB1_FULL_37_110]|nr:MAG: hypothetical protein A2417_02140 [Bdellovibrionales bacterium RIFOXYC1_FULL_37_79]OFZ58850.1 MAG: hypothetical protein A2381_01285 [Bdellovibrionales bacterium RIFOXYB1_FULL_37_110]OFZ64849.1 MAG: hypothetical protein A2577_07285 [Bdellovibrionales bacterium RIFOXYD1_FULL_36_51]
MELLKRNILKSLHGWNDSPIRSPLLLIGPRQIGKTTLLQIFGRQISRRFFEINFWSDSNQTLKKIFQRSLEPAKILNELADYFEVDAINPKEDVLFFDEIQESPEAYASLKLFKEKMKELRILVTGSYLQLFLKTEEIKKLPVGCVDEFYLGPLSYTEFLENYDERIFQKYNQLDLNNFEITIALHEKLMELLNEYFFTGGLPEIIFLYLSGNKNYQTRQDIRKKQKDLLNQYTLDFQKYGKSVHIKKIDQIFQSIPFQLERVNDQSTNRFSYKDLGKNIKYQSLHWSFQYLKNAGLIIRSFIVSRPDHPFRVHEQKEERNLFKCFYFDIGLLNAALNSSIKISLEDWGSYKGYIAENFVAISLYNMFQTELITYKKSSKHDSAEIEFLITDENNNIIPVEVKSSKKALSSKSLDSFVKEFSPKRAYKLVPILSEKFKRNEYVTIPLYMIDKMEDGTA